MDRAIQIAGEQTIGCVALRNTHHWMRPGAYGLQAADAGCIGICWTNTIPNMPPWGGKEPKLGNNPIVLAVPRAEGHILLDMAVSMFSYGKLESYAIHDQMLPVDGGFDDNGNLTKDPKAVLETKQPLPIGCWKGSGLSLLLDLIAMVLSGGNSSLQVGKSGTEIGLSQLFIAFDLSKLSGKDFMLQSLEETIADLHRTTPIREDGTVSYPGERMLHTRKENLEKGVPVEPIFWEQVLRM
ncbi:MAG: Ldh family oxidoreductase, partial [Bacteroidota bacterium]